MNLKFTGQCAVTIKNVGVVTMKNNTKFEKELTCQFKTDMRNVKKIDPNTQKSYKFSF